MRFRGDQKTMKIDPRSAKIRKLCFWGGATDAPDPELAVGGGSLLATYSRTAVLSTYTISTYISAQYKKLANGILSVHVYLNGH